MSPSCRRLYHLGHCTSLDKFTPDDVACTEAEVLWALRDLDKQYIYKYSGMVQSEMLES